MIRRPPRSTRMTHSFPTRRSSDLTVESLILDSRNIFLRGIANVFSRLDRRFRTHDAFAIGSKIIFDCAFSEYGSWSGRHCDEYLRDVERTFHVLDGREQPDRYAGIIGAIDQERTGLERKAWVAESEFFRSEEHTSELQSLMRISYAISCL